MDTILRGKTFYQSLIVVFIVFASSHGYGNGLCTGKDASLSCLMKHSNELYLKNMDLFWKILDNAASKAKKCERAQDTADFLNLVQISRDAAIAEYFSEQIEELCISNTDCFLEGLMLLKPFDQDRIIYELYNPLVVDEAEITKAFNKYKNSVKYKRVIDLYMKKFDSKKK